SATGSLARPLDARELAVTLVLRAESLHEFGALADASLPAVGPVEIRGQLTGSQDSYRVSGMHATVEDSDLSGDVVVSFGGARPKVTAHLTSKLINEAVFLPAEEEEGAKIEKKPDRLFPSEPLTFTVLHTLDAALDMDATVLRLPDMELQQVQLSLNLTGGILRVKRATALLNGGNVSVDLRLDTSQNVADVSLQLDARKVEMGRVLKYFGKRDLIGGGLTNVKMFLSGRGNSIAALMASLNGRVLVDMGEAEMQNRTLEVIGADLLSQSVRILNPFSKEEKTTRLLCSVVFLSIKNGIVTSDNGIAAETDKIYVIGSGIINLETEEVDIGIHPVARKGIGIGAGSLTEMMRVRGSLAKPSLAPDVMGIGKEGLRIGAAISTGGISLLAEGLYGRTVADTHPCAAVLGRASAAEKEESRSEAKEGKKDKEPKESGGLLRNIFGK
ncbi:MAG: AsmA family protein, partial [bacterium]